MTNRKTVLTALVLGLKVVALGVALSLTGCHTTQGVGRDIESAGKGIDDAATGVGNDMGADMNESDNQ